MLRLPEGRLRNHVRTLPDRLGSDESGLLDGREQSSDDPGIELGPAHPSELGDCFRDGQRLLLTTKAVSLRFTATSGTSQIDDVYLDPFKDT